MTSRHFLLLAASVLLVAIAQPKAALAQTDVIRGRVTDVDGQPLGNVRVTATSIPGNVTRSANTNNQGRYQIAFPGGPGDYIMGYTLFGYNFKQFEIKRLADEDVLIADTRLAPMTVDTLMVVAARQERPSRNQQTPDVSGTERFISPNGVPLEQRGDIAAMAASLPGVLLVPGLDGNADGFSVLGLPSDQSNVTLNGLPSSSNNLPRDAAISTSLTTSPYDVSRGGFSGANFNVRSRSGSNFRSRGVSLVATTPQMQWTDRAAQAVGTDYTNLSFGGVLSGPIKLNKSFYNISYQLGRQSRGNQTLQNTSPIGLQTAGILTDSVARFLHILNTITAPSGSPAAIFRSQHSDRLSDNGSFFGSFDIAPPGSATGQSFGITLNGNWRKQAPAISGVTQLESSGGDRTNWAMGAQSRHTGYLGLVLSETSLGINTTHDFGDPYVDMPGGRVRVSSIFADGTNSVQSLVFGGNQNLSSSSQSTNTSFQNTLSWFDNNNKHRIKLTTELQYNRMAQDMSSNLLGSFSFNSLADLAAGIPASFTRTLVARERTNGLVNGALAIGDSYRRSPDLQFQYGVRMDVSHYTTTPTANPLIQQLFGRSNDAVPTPVVFSPRIGFSWTVGRVKEIASFVGAASQPRAVVRAGIGLFANSANVSQIGSVLDNTGLANGAQQIVCIGPAAPFPTWSSFAENAATIPTRCADGTTGSLFANSAPNVTLFASDYAPPRNVRSNLSWDGRILDGRFSLNVEGTYSRNLNQQRWLDINFQPTTRFTLGDDGRPVFVQPSSIVVSTGSIASGDARVTTSFARVNEIRSDLKSHTGQLSIRLSPIPRSFTRFSWNAAYTYQHIREQVSGFSSTASDPRTIEWTSAAQGPHQINYSVRYRFFDAVDVSWSGSFRSGMAFTPMVAGDINGDGGFGNDRAFVFGANAADPAVAAGMQQLLASSTGRTRECLEKQTGTIAARNSCRSPWSSSAFLNISLDRAKFHMPQRGEVSFSLSNPLGAADLLINGSGNLKGWGQSAFPDQSLLYVRGFDATTNRYRYEVNQRFGATRPQFLTLRTPVTLTATMRFDFGPTRERQMLMQQLASGRSLPGSPLPDQMYRMMASNNVMNPMGQILRSQDTLQLTSLQADSIASMNRRYTYRADSLWAPVAKYYAQLPKTYDESEAYRRYIEARHSQVDMLITSVKAVNDLLQPPQRRKLPFFIINSLDPRYLALTRDGTPIYISSGGMGMFGMGDFGFSMSSFSSIEGGFVMMMGR